MGNSRNTGYLQNSIKVDNSGNISFVSGSTTLATINSSGQFSGSSAVLSASYAASASNALAAASASYILTAQTASYVLNAVSASYAASASNALAAQTASYANTFTVGSTLTAQTLVVQTITSSVDYVTGSTRFGSLLSNTHVFSGSVTMNPNGLFVSSSGLVGVGTTSPSNTLDVSGSIRGFAPDARITSYSITGGSFAGFSGYSAEGNGGFHLLSPTTGSTSHVTTVGNFDTYLSTRYSNNLILATNNTERMRISASGLIGIGLTNPFTPLHLHANGNYSTSSNMTTGFAISNSTTGRALNMGVFDSGGYGWMQAAYINNAGVTFNLALQPQGGNVGIGTTNPTATLHTKSTQQISVFASTTTTNYSEVQVENTTNYLQVGVEGGSGNRMGGTIAYNAYLGSYNNYGMTFHTNNLNRMTITNGGYVGIGTTSPNAHLMVEASRNAYYVARFNNTNASGYGIKIINGNDNNDAFRISNAADTADNVLFYGNGNGTFKGSATAAKFNTFNGNISVPYNTATQLGNLSADGGNASMYLVVAAIGGAGTENIAMGILVTISQGGGTARWALQNNGAQVTLSDPSSNGVVYVTQTKSASAQTVNYSVLRIG